MLKLRNITNRSLRRDAGMTLIEIMIVLAIIALIMGVLVGPRVFRAFQGSQGKTAWLNAKLFEQAYTRWSAENSDAPCPDSLDALLKFMDKKDTKDPWGQPYQMVCGDSAPAEATIGFGVTSPGKDKKPGTEDDIRSWDDKPPKE